MQAPNKVVNLMRFATLRFCGGFATLPQNSTLQTAQVTTALGVKSMYNLRVPFRIQPGSLVKLKEGDVDFDGLLFKVKKEGGGYVLVVKGFESPESAKEYFSRVSVGLYWVLLHAGIAPVFPSDLKIIEASKDPNTTGENIANTLGANSVEPIDGIFKATDAAIFEDLKNFKVLIAHNANITYSASLDRFFDFLFSGISLDDGIAAIKDKKLRISLDMYSSYYSEVSANAKYLALIMSLETLCESIPRPTKVIDLIQEFQSGIRAQLKITHQADEKVALEALIREVDFRKGSSIRVQVRTLVSNAYKSNGDSGFEELARRAVKLYDYRSELVHNGELKNGNISELTQELREIVEGVLRSRLTSGCTT